MAIPQGFFRLWEAYYAQIGESSHWQLLMVLRRRLYAEGGVVREGAEETLSPMIFAGLFQMKYNIKYKTKQISQHEVAT